MQLILFQVFFVCRRSGSLLKFLINTIAIVQRRVCSGCRKELHYTNKQAKAFLSQKAICEKASTESLLITIQNVPIASRAPRPGVVMFLGNSKMITILNC